MVDKQNVQNPPYGITQGSFSVSLNNPTFSSLTPLGPSTQFSPSSGVTAIGSNDTAQPKTQSYSLTLAQRMPWQSVLELAHVGNKSDYVSNWNNNFDQINDIGIGGFVFKDGWNGEDYSADK